jgi:hypothetical protein
LFGAGTRGVNAVQRSRGLHEAYACVLQAVNPPTPLHAPTPPLSTPLSQPRSRRPNLWPHPTSLNFFSLGRCDTQELHRSRTTASDDTAGPWKRTHAWQGRAYGGRWGSVCRPSDKVWGVQPCASQGLCTQDAQSHSHVVMWPPPVPARGQQQAPTPTIWYPLPVDLCHLCQKAVIHMLHLNGSSPRGGCRCGGRPVFLLCNKRARAERKHRESVQKATQHSCLVHTSAVQGGAKPDGCPTLASKPAGFVHLPWATRNAWPFPALRLPTEHFPTPGRMHTETLAHTNTPFIRAHQPGKTVKAAVRGKVQL